MKWREIVRRCAPHCETAQPQKGLRCEIVRRGAPHCEIARFEDSPHCETRDPSLFLENAYLPKTNQNSLVASLRAVTQ